MNRCSTHVIYNVVMSSLFENIKTRKVNSVSLGCGVVDSLVNETLLPPSYFSNLVNNKSKFIARKNGQWVKWSVV